MHQDGDGFIYLKLSEAFITDLVPFLGNPCEAFSFAHIPVVLPHEWAQKKGWGELNLEQTFTFEIDRLCSIKPKRLPGVDKVYFLSISCPDLEKFRERLLLPSRIRGHDFHIAIAYKKSSTIAHNETFRLNVSCHAA